jgi:hypothetical protein
VIETVVRWSDARSADQKWGIIAIEFLRRARRDGTLDERHRHLFVSQWEEIGDLLMSKLQLDADAPVSAVDLGGLVLELSYGGISGYLNVNTAGQMVRHVLQATLTSSRLAHAE